MQLAKEQSEKNPVYYVQYAHARICSILRKSPHLNNFAYPSMAKGEEEISLFDHANLLRQPAELSLIKQLVRFPEIVEDTAKDYQAQRVPQYAMELATAFSSILSGLQGDYRG